MKLISAQRFKQPCTQRTAQKSLLPQPQFHHREIVASAQLVHAVLNHYKCQMASVYFQEDQRFGTQAHDPQASREGSTLLETVNG